MLLLNKFKMVSYCDEDSSNNSLVDEADAILAERKPRVSTPVQYMEVHDLIGRAQVYTFDGFRVQVQKQLNLNTVATHLLVAINFLYHKSCDEITFFTVTATGLDLK